MAQTQAQMLYKYSKEEVDFRDANETTGFFGSEPSTNIHECLFLSPGTILHAVDLAVRDILGGTIKSGAAMVTQTHGKNVKPSKRLVHMFLALAHSPILGFEHKP